MAADPKAEAIRRAYDAFNRRDPDAAGADMHPEFELDFTGSVGPERGVYRGKDGMSRLWRRYWDAFESISIEPEELIEAGDQVIALVRARGRGRGSGIEIDARGPHVWTFRDGKVVRFKLYQEVGQAMEAVLGGEADNSPAPAPQSARPTDGR